ncbi:branched-chain amino acid transporter permease [Corynebacterium sp. 5QC2CO]|uniref:branched-chain amino acid transporter permease n=1 Tax=Corynebacterium sp. 5QC2CO TaxID=2968468 RepID=UPI00211BC8CE|nr:AzlD domain-containing protein [Corynebacterium sp. 5QC2CO]MCQ9350538.1 AzlD domain-containing protein [Corynebacterium sp. 5QC2CO]
MTAMPDSGYVLAALFAMGAVTVALRALPFAFVRTLKGSPLFEFLGTTMPVGVMVALVVYTVFGRLGLSGEGGDPGATWAVPVALVVTIGLHWWRRNTVISIFVGTALYMVLVNLVA